MLIRLPPPDPPAASITPPPHQSGRSCVDPPPPKLQSITSTTATSLLFERMRDQRLWACTWHSTCSFQFATAVFLFYLITDRDCVDLSSINVDASEGRGCCCAPSRSQQRRSWSSPLRRRHRPDQAAAASTWPPPYSDCRPPPRLRRPPRPRLPRYQSDIICMWYSQVSAPITAYAPSRRCSCGGCQFVRFYLLLILQSHRLWCSRCDCGGMLEYIW
jgi:hypothetical protein